MPRWHPPPHAAISGCSAGPCRRRSKRVTSTAPHHARAVTSPTWQHHRIGRSIGTYATQGPACGCGGARAAPTGRPAICVGTPSYSESPGGRGRCAAASGRVRSAPATGGRRAAFNVPGHGGTRRFSLVFFPDAACGVRARDGNVALVLASSAPVAEMRWTGTGSGCCVPACPWLMRAPPIVCVGYGMDSPRVVVADARPSSGLFWKKGRRLQRKRQQK